MKSLTRKVPATDATGRHTPRTPATIPRCATGTWSGSTATMTASRALNPTWATHHPSRTNGIVGAQATTRTPRDPPTRPVTIHGRRIPNRDVVRSLSLPQNGLASMATAAPTPATSARLFGAWSSPTSEFTFNAKLTSSGARNNRHVLMYASVYSTMNLHRTGRAAMWSGSVGLVVVI